MTGMAKSFFQFNSLEYKGTNLLSLLCAVGVVAYIVWLRLKKPGYVSRVSIKLQATIAFFDIIRHLNNIFNYTANEDGCKFLGFIFFFSYHFNTFLNVAIASNLQMVFLLEKAPSEGLQPLLFVTPFVTAFVIDVVPFAFNGYGKSFITFCHVNFSHTGREGIKALILYLTNYPFIIYCFVIAVLVFVKLANSKHMCDPEAQALFPTIHGPLSRTLALRVALYPLACFICHFGDIICNLCALLSINSYAFQAIAFMGVSLNGTINLGCFLLDPYVIESFYVDIADPPVSPIGLELEFSPIKSPRRKISCPSLISETRLYISHKTKDNDTESQYEAFWNQF